MHTMSRLEKRNGRRGGRAYQPHSYRTGTMLGNIRWKWKQGKIKTIYLLALAVFFLGAYIWRPSFGQNNTTAGQKAANTLDKAKLPPNPVDQVGQITPGVEKQEEFRPFALFSDPKYSSLERISLVVVLVIVVL